ncbi:MAG: VCBS repeat-containing protein, partial [Gammaproteobacteria bacterium]|nr:VCBS repeat-containing protein [Gammaproteobacteria bacterium]
MQTTPYFPAANHRLQGFVRIVNHTANAGEIRIDAFDDDGRRHGPVTLKIDGRQTVHFNSNDLENGNTAKGLSGSTGAGHGSWRLTFESALDIEVLSYVRTEDGFLTSMHDLAPAARGRHRIATFNPGSNLDQRSLLRLVNASEEAADVTIRGIDDRGASPGRPVEVIVPARSSTSLSAEELEVGGDRFTGALGNGSGKWQLLVDSGSPIAALGLLSSPTGHLTNLSSAPGRDHTPPRLVSPGAIAMEWGTWAGDVTHDTLGFQYAGDIDDDGDDDLVITSYSADPQRPGAGVILLNNGDFSFSVAGGDRPGGVHPGEVLVADFNGDGRNDLFIADVGFDAPPFPGWHNQLLLWTEDGYVDATERMPADPTGFTHNAAAGDIDGDGDVDILVANAFGEWISGPYFLLNDGQANFVADTKRLPDVMETDFRPWAVDLLDLDRDGHEDLIAGATADDPEGRSFVYWGSDDGTFHDDVATVLPKPGFFADYGDADVITIGVHDCNGDGLPDLLFAGYDTETFTKRGVQLLVNAGRRAFFDETRYRLGDSASSPTEWWLGAHR